MLSVSSRYATFAGSLFPLSYTVTHALGMRSFRHIAAKHPAAPSPIMAILVAMMGLCLIFLLSYKQIFLCQHILRAVWWRS